MVKKTIICSVLAYFFSSSIYGQSLLDFSVGTTVQDQFVTGVTYQKQFSEKFRGGVQVQYGLAKERFIGAKRIDEGYALSASIPMALLLSDQKRIQLFGIAKLGFRFQNVIDPDNNNMQDSILSSNAFIGDFGFLSNLKATENLYFQAGVSFPIGLEFSPSSIFEYQWTNIHLGSSYKFNNQVLFLKGNVGPAFGASGDTYKFMWSLKAGLRLSFGTKEVNNKTFIETTL